MQETHLQKEDICTLHAWIEDLCGSKVISLLTSHDLAASGNNMRIDDRESFKYYMQILNIERTLNSSSVKRQKTTARELSNMQIFYSTHRTMKSCRFFTLGVLEEVKTTPHSL